MQGHRIGYVRVSSFDQNPERQLEQTQVSKVFTDKASGKDTQRPQLEALLSFVREGDTVVGHCCKVSDEAAFCLIQRPYISKTLLTRRISP
ncbi:recombinase family protein, partial [Klebsiella pneumoniae]|uniref:recombinase family protein n=1 Tax=Klebsiella pneumoniae TaxID=573 RepID=UPI0021647483